MLIFLQQALNDWYDNFVVLKIFFETVIWVIWNLRLWQLQNIFATLQFRPFSAASSKYLSLVDFVLKLCYNPQPEGVFNRQLWICHVYTIIWLSVTFLGSDFASTPICILVSFFLSQGGSWQGRWEKHLIAWDTIWNYQLNFIFISISETARRFVKGHSNCSKWQVRILLKTTFILVRFFKHFTITCPSL